MNRWLRGLLGRKGEHRAAAFLKKKGLRIVGRGVANRCGEIDLIALDGETIVFVEVRTRQSLDAGHPAESVTVEKQAKVTRAAVSYLKSNRLLNRHCRFDVVALVWPEGAREPKIEHYQSAFEAVGPESMYG
jgi:putative endonuclease